MRETDTAVCWRWYTEHQHVRGLRGREGGLGGWGSMLLWLRRAKTLESLGVEEG